MATSTTVTRAPRIAASDEALDEIADGLANAAATAERVITGGETDPGVLAWEQLVDEVARQVAPVVAQLLEQAIAERLPWTAPEA